MLSLVTRQLKAACCMNWMEVMQVIHDIEWITAHSRGKQGKMDTWGGREGKEVGRDGKVWEVRSRALFFTMLQFQPSSQLFVKAWALRMSGSWALLPEAGSSRVSEFSKPLLYSGPIIRKNCSTVLIQQASSSVWAVTLRHCWWPAW